MNLDELLCEIYKDTNTPLFFKDFTIFIVMLVTIAAGPLFIFKLLVLLAAVAVSLFLLSIISEAFLTALGRLFVIGAAGAVGITYGLVILFLTFIFKLIFLGYENR